MSQSTRSYSLIVRRQGRRMQWLLSGCAVALVGIPLAASQLDTALRGEVDSSLDDPPADPLRPFVATMSELRTRRRFHEPETHDSAAGAGVANTTTASHGGPAIAPEIMNKARRIYAERCASCHGDKGNGDGPGAFAVKPRPRDYTDPEWQKTVTDEELAKAIVKGGTAVGKSYMMPANYDLRSKPEVTAALVAMVRSFAKR